MRFFITKICLLFLVLSQVAFSGENVLHKHFKSSLDKDGKVTLQEMAKIIEPLLAEKQDKLGKLLNEQDDEGLTPLLYVFKNYKSNSAVFIINKINKYKISGLIDLSLKAKDGTDYLNVYKKFKRSKEKNDVYFKFLVKNYLSFISLSEKSPELIFNKYLDGEIDPDSIVGEDFKGFKVLIGDSIKSFGSKGLVESVTKFDSDKVYKILESGISPRANIKYRESEISLPLYAFHKINELKGEDKSKMINILHDMVSHQKETFFPIVDENKNLLLHLIIKSEEIELIDKIKIVRAMLNSEKLLLEYDNTPQNTLTLLENFLIDKVETIIDLNKRNLHIKSINSQVKALALERNLLKKKIKDLINDKELVHKVVMDYIPLSEELLTFQASFRDTPYSQKVRKAAEAIKDGKTSGDLKFAQTYFYKNFLKDKNEVVSGAIDFKSNNLDYFSLYFKFREKYNDSKTPERLILNDFKYKFIAKNNPLMIVRKLIDWGASIDKKDEFGATPLHYVYLNNHKDIAEYLLNKGADINVQDNNGKTPLHNLFYVDDSHEEYLRRLQEEGDSTMFHRNVGGLKNRRDIIKVFLDRYSPDLTIKDNSSEKVLIGKAFFKKRKEEIARFKAEKEAARIAKEKEKESKEKVKDKTTEVTKKAEAPKKVEVAKKVEVKQTSLLELAVAFENRLKKKKLSELKSNYKYKIFDKINNEEYIVADYLNNDRNELLHKSIEKLDIETVKLILKVPNIDIERKNDGSGLMSPLEIAIEKGDAEVFKLLRKNGAKINVQEINSLIDSLEDPDSSEDEKAIAKGLIDSITSDTLFKDLGNGKTLLHRIASSYITEHARVLVLDKKMEVDAKDDFGKTALDYAIESNNSNMVKVLISLGASPYTKSDRFIKHQYDIIKDKALRGDSKLYKEGEAQKLFFEIKDYLGDNKLYSEKFRSFLGNCTDLSEDKELSDCLDEFEHYLKENTDKTLSSIIFDHPNLLFDAIRGEVLSNYEGNIDQFLVAPLLFDRLTLENKELFLPAARLLAESSLRNYKARNRSIPIVIEAKKGLVNTLNNIKLVKENKIMTLENTNKESKTTIEKCEVEIKGLKEENLELKESNARLINLIQKCMNKKIFDSKDLSVEKKEIEDILRSIEEKNKVKTPVIEKSKNKPE